MGQSLTEQLEGAIRKAGPGKVMLSKSLAKALLAALTGQPGCALQEEGLPCGCGVREPGCPHRRD